ncbi:flavin reductase family protein [Dactylosporangium sp. CS-033363]|uniref:flavin reductase family protein n=1 Tax=Dactylosporangium sp. CS-033363 TaxID=3239935 RepID=UPI003D9148FA
MDVQQEAPTGTLDTRVLRTTFGAFATGVTVVTVGGAAPHGMTANSFTSVSLDPPLVSVCVERQAIMHASLTDAGVFGVSVLSARQEAVARHFANRHRPLGRQQFDAVDWLPGERTGAPLIAGSLAHFECRVWRRYDGGDHTIFLGELLAAGGSVAPGDALLFLAGRFHALEPVPTEAPR